MRIPTWILAAFAVPPPPEQYTVSSTRRLDFSSNVVASTHHLHPLDAAASLWLSSAPSNEDVTVLRQAFAEYYGVDRDLVKSEQLLSDALTRWQGQPPDELAGLYRVRGDCHMLLSDAVKAASDYTQAIHLLQGPGGEKADPAELQAALLGRARAIKSQQGITAAQTSQSANDYKQSLQLSSREEWDTEEELLEDGSMRNPYATWEWGSVLRQSGKLQEAATAHGLAAQAFDEVGDKARAVMSLIDTGVDLAAAGKVEDAESLLEKAIAKTKGVQSRDVGLLQRVIAKEGEGSMALAALLWNDGDRPKAEQVLGNACIRMEQLQADAASRPSLTQEAVSVPKPLAYSIDDSIRPLEFSCARFKNEAFLSQQLGWPDALQKKVMKLQSLR
jgi:tetratricopeptide (TPR) repeat protein